MLSQGRGYSQKDKVPSRTWLQKMGKRGLFKDFTANS